jgi:membrane-bound serine protease (ClpP class)
MRSVLATVFVLLGLGVPALAQQGQTVEVIDISGALDQRIIEFAIESIEAASAGGVEVVVLQIDSPGVIDGEEQLQDLIALVAAPPVPVVTWIGPSPAVAYGGAGQLVLASRHAFAAPDSEIGYLAPTVAGIAPIESPLLIEAPSSNLVDGVLPVEEVEAIEVSDRTAAPRQLAQALHERSLTTDGGPVTVQTVAPFTAPDGSEGVSVIPTTIREPNLWDQFLRLAASPEAAFFFLAVGLTVAAFEFYAIGPGIAAAVAAVSLFLAGYGIATLPVRWWAVALAVVAHLVLAGSYQRGGIPLVSIAGMALLAVSGFAFTDAAPQITPGAPGVLLTIGAVGFFFLIAMPTVARSRFSTQTIGREGLIGRRGVAVSALSPDGEVEVEGARWLATSHRESGIVSGDEVEVIAVDGWYLEVEPLQEA